MGSDESRELAYSGGEYTVIDEDLFMEAIEKGDFLTVNALIKEDRVDPGANIRRYACSNWPIIEASRRGHENIVELLLKDPRVDPNIIDGVSLYVAAYEGHLGVVKMLLDYENAEDPSKEIVVEESAALEAAANRGHPEIVKTLLEDGRADPNLLHNEAFLNAALNGRIEVLKVLLTDPRVEPDAEDNEAIIAAADSGKTATVAFLLTIEGVDATAQNNKAIKFALRRKSYDIVILLIESGAVSRDDEGLFDVFKWYDRFGKDEPKEPPSSILI